MSALELISRGSTSCFADMDKIRTVTYKRKTYLTSVRHMNDLSSLKVNALPANTVCAVSPAQNNPFGFLQRNRSTVAYNSMSSTACLTSDIEKSGRTASVYEKVVLCFINEPRL